MKRITMIASTVVIAFALTAFTVSNWNDQPKNECNGLAYAEIEPPKFFYDLSSGSSNTVSKERLHNAKTLSDLIPDFSIQEDLKNNQVSLRSVKVRFAEENSLQCQPSCKKGNENDLSKDQVKLFGSMDYSSNFFLEGYIIPNGQKINISNERFFNYNMTVVPEQQASYRSGNNAFLDFLKMECQATIAKVQKGDLKSGNISFTVTTSGTISNIDMDSSCGYPSVDERMLELMNELPDGWNIATNGKGEKMDQTLVFSYGQGGC